MFVSIIEMTEGNEVLEKVMGHHKKSNGSSHRHMGMGGSYPIVMLGSRSKPIRTLSGSSMGSGSGVPNIRIEELLGDFV